MYDQTLSTHVRDSGQNLAAIELQGRLDSAAETTLMEAFDRTAGKAAVLLNFSLLEEIDGAGTGLLILLSARAARQGTRLLACGVNAPLQQVFRLFALDESIAFCAGEAEAAQTPPQTRPWPEIAGQSLAGWAAQVDRMDAAGLPGQARTLNLQNRRAVGPFNGFGRLFRKTYVVSLAGAGLAPAEVVQVWKVEFPTFWPKGNVFFGPPGPLSAGQAAALHLAGPGGMNYPGGMPMIATGLRVVHAGETSFSFLSAEGHILAGLITFSAFSEQGDTFARVQAVGRASDPLFEFMFRLGMAHKLEDTFWLQTLTNLAARFGLERSAAMRVEYFDPALQWSRAGNIWQNAAIRSGLDWVLSPLRWLFGRKR